MGRGGEGAVVSTETKEAVTWEEVKKHSSRDDKWLVIKQQVYNITNWSKKHPGGTRVISHYAGQDATEAFRAFHNDPVFVNKFLKPIHIGPLQDKPREDEEPDTIREDFEELRQTVRKAGHFRPSVCFYVTNILHLLVLEALAYMTLSYLGTGWLPWLLSVLFYSTVQAQAGWTQHDFGHLSVFSSTKLNHIVHMFVMNFIKGAGCDWWNHMHYQHHAKPNVINKDPDVRLDALFVLGEDIPKKVAKNRKHSMPFNWQHRYFFAIGPPLLFPVYFQYMIFRHAITRRRWLELFITLLFYVKFVVLYTPLLGFWGMVKYYFMVRCMESHWFVWVSQSNHIPMEIAEDKERPWVSLQLHATCDIEKSAFNDWFTGHLNFQIEHHLFPTMPRHNLYKVAPLVQSLCKKHGIAYSVKTLYGAFSDIVKTLKTSGELWEHYYEAYHLS